MYYLLLSLNFIKIEEIIISAFTGGVVGALITGIFTLLNNIIKNIHESKERKEKLKAKEKGEYNDLKRETYLKTLKYLKYLKMSFEVTKQDYSQDKEGRKQIDDAYSKIDDAYALIRLYSSEKVFNLFNAITHITEVFLFQMKVAGV